MKLGNLWQCTSYRLSMLVMGVAIFCAVGTASSGLAAKRAVPVHGGALTVVASNDVDSLDPGRTYITSGYMVQSAVNRALYAYRANDRETAVPDLAAGAPEISKDLETITIAIRRGVHFSAPVNREVTAQDAAYGLQRAFSPNVANPYASYYLADLAGVDAYTSGKATSISGITTKGKYTLVLNLTKPDARVFAQALVLPFTAPVPQSYAAPYDAQSPSTYAQHEVFTGPYMVANDGHGNITGYTPGSSLRLVRNPAWKPDGIRSAYVNSIQYTIGVDPTVAGRQVLTGRGSVLAGSPPAPIVASAVQSYRSQVAIVPGELTRFIALNTSIPPFNNLNVRRAVYAAVNKLQLRVAFGGGAAGYVATHVIPPDVPGFSEAGGFRGPALDFERVPGGSLAVAQKYLRAAGFADGKYSGPAVSMVGDNTDPGASVAQILLRALQQLGFEVNFQAVTHSAMYSKFCQVPASKTQICPNVNFGLAFGDAQSLLQPLFSGANILPKGNVNFAELNDTAINSVIARAAAAAAPATRAVLWAKVDDMVMSSAAVIPYLWDNLILLRASNVHIEPAKWDGTWDLTSAWVAK